MTLRGGASVGGDEEHREEREREKERTRVAFVREVEVLRVSLPSLLFGTHLVPRPGSLSNRASVLFSSRTPPTHTLSSTYPTLT